MIPAMVTVHVSLPEPPGDRGRKLEYFLAKPRHRIATPLMLFNSATLLVAAWFTWRSQSRGIALCVAAMSLATAFLAALVWRQGKRREERVRQARRGVALPLNRGRDRVI
jgi:hypothetical protein